jgi:uncharacterized protein (DUF433 family)
VTRPDGIALHEDFAVTQAVDQFNPAGSDHGDDETCVDGATARAHPVLMNWRERIVSDPNILRGKPCIAGTRIPVALILGYLAVGKDAEAIIREFPDVAAADVAACLHYARDLADFDAAA